MEYPTLVNGMVVKTRDGELYTVITDFYDGEGEPPAEGRLISHEAGGIPLKDYDIKLRHVDHDYNDIVEISVAHDWGNMLNHEDLDSTWKRAEKSKKQIKAEDEITELQKRICDYRTTLGFLESDLMQATVKLEHIVSGEPF